MSRTQSEKVKASLETYPPEFLREVTKAVVKREANVNEDGALEMLLKNRLSKGDFLNIRGALVRNTSTTLPLYQKVWKTERKCYPQSFVATETSGPVALQSLLDHTVT